MILQVQRYVTDEEIAEDVGAKLFNRHGHIAQLLAHELVIAALEKGFIQFVTELDPTAYRRVIRARMVVGEEHVHIIEKGPYASSTYLP